MNEPNKINHYIISQIATFRRGKEVQKKIYASIKGIAEIKKPDIDKINDLISSAYDYSCFASQKGNAGKIGRKAIRNFIKMPIAEVIAHLS